MLFAFATPVLNTVLLNFLTSGKKTDRLRKRTNFSFSIVLFEEKDP